jgi:hypothetical protein
MTNFVLMGDVHSVRSKFELALNFIEKNIEELKNTGKVTVQKGDTISSIAKAVTTATGKKFTTAQITAAIKKNPVLGPRLGTGKTVLFSGSSFTFEKPNASGVTSAATVSTNNISSNSFVAPMVSSPEPPTPAPVKMPSRDVVSLVDPGIDSATIQNLLFENIGATDRKSVV